MTRSSSPASSHPLARRARAARARSSSSSRGSRWSRRRGPPGRPSRCRSRAGGRPGRGRACRRSARASRSWASLERRRRVARRPAHEYIIGSSRKARRGRCRGRSGRRCSRGAPARRVARDAARAPAGRAAQRARGAGAAGRARRALRAAIRSSGDEVVGVPEAARRRPRRGRGCRAASGARRAGRGPSTAPAARRRAGPNGAASPALDDARSARRLTRRRRRPTAARASASARGELTSSGAVRPGAGSTGALQLQPQRLAVDPRHDLRASSPGSARAGRRSGRGVELAARAAHSVASKTVLAVAAAGLDVDRERSPGAVARQS